eukprot:scaffold679685_cov39-Prasinocladus_malaysianus.AAC.1
MKYESDLADEVEGIGHVRLDVPCRPGAHGGGVVRHHHRGGGVPGGPREPLPQLLGHKRHERVQQTQAVVEAQPQRLPVGGLFLLAVVVLGHGGLDELDEDVAHFVLPEGVDGGGGAGKVVGLHGGHDGRDGVVQTAHDPPGMSMGAWHMSTPITGKRRK